MRYLRKTSIFHYALATSVSNRASAGNNPNPPHSIMSCLNVYVKYWKTGFNQIWGEQGGAWLQPFMRRSVAEAWRAGIKSLYKREGSVQQTVVLRVLNSFGQIWNDVLWAKWSSDWRATDITVQWEVSPHAGQCHSVHSSAWLAWSLTENKTSCFNHNYVLGRRHSKMPTCTPNWIRRPHSPSGFTT